MNDAKPFDRPEESGSGRLLTILLVVAAIGGALWLFLGQNEGARSALEGDLAKTITIDGRRYRCTVDPDPVIHIHAH